MIIKFPFCISNKNFWLNVFITMFGCFLKNIKYSHTLRSCSEFIQHIKHPLLLFNLAHRWIWNNFYLKHCTDEKEDGEFLSSLSSLYYNKVLVVVARIYSCWMSNEQDRKYLPQKKFFKRFNISQKVVKNCWWKWK